MTSEELAQKVEEIIKRCTSRVLGVGFDQYDRGNVQSFEIEGLDLLAQGILEELEDTINWSCMAHIRVQALQARLERLGDGVMDAEVEARGRGE